MAVTLQNCLDKIGYIGTPTVSLSDLTSLTEKFSMNCPFSTLHVVGSPLTNEVEARDRVIVDGVGGTCVALSSVFKFILDEIGFNSKYVRLGILDGSLDDQSAIVVTIDGSDWICIFGLYHQRLCKAYKLEDGYTDGLISISYSSPNYIISNTQSEYNVTTDNVSRTLSYWTTTATDATTSGELVDKNIIVCCTGLDTARIYFNGVIIEIDSNGDRTYYNHTTEDLSVLFKYSGTV